MRTLWRGSGVNIGLSFLAVFAMGPLLWMLSVSLMAPGEASSFPPPLLPENPTLDNYIMLFEYSSMGRNFLNSLFVASAATLLSLTFNVSAEYAGHKGDQHTNPAINQSHAFQHQEQRNHRNLCRNDQGA